MRLRKLRIFCFAVRGYMHSTEERTEQTSIFNPRSVFACAPLHAFKSTTSSDAASECADVWRHGLIHAVRDWRLAAARVVAVPRTRAGSCWPWARQRALALAARALATCALFASVDLSCSALRSSRSLPLPSGAGAVEFGCCAVPRRGFARVECGRGCRRVSAKGAAGVRALEYKHTRF